MDIDLIAKIIIIITMLMGVIYLIYPEIKNRNKKNKYVGDSIEVNPQVSQEETFKELDNMIMIFMEDYIYTSKLAKKDIYINSTEFNKITERLSTDIISSLSPKFKNKMKLFFTERAMNVYITKKVIRLLAEYASTINMPS